MSYSDFFHWPKTSNVPYKKSMFVSPRTVNSFPFAVVKVLVTGTIFVTSPLFLHVPSFKILTVAPVSSNIQVTLWFAIPVTYIPESDVSDNTLLFAHAGLFTSLTTTDSWTTTPGLTGTAWLLVGPSFVSPFFVWTISSEMTKFAASKTYHLIPAPPGQSRFSLSFQLRNLFIYTKHEFLELTNLRWNFLALCWTIHRIHRLFLLSWRHSLTSSKGTF